MARLFFPAKKEIFFERLTEPLWGLNTSYKKGGSERGGKVRYDGEKEGEKGKAVDLKYGCKKKYEIKYRNHKMAQLSWAIKKKNIAKG